MKAGLTTESLKTLKKLGSTDEVREIAKTTFALPAAGSATLNDLTATAYTVKVA